MKINYNYKKRASITIHLSLDEIKRILSRAFDLRFNKICVLSMRFNVVRFESDIKRVVNSF